MRLRHEQKRATKRAALQTCISRAESAIEPLLAKGTLYCSPCFTGEDIESLSVDDAVGNDGGYVEDAKAAESIDWNCIPEHLNPSRGDLNAQRALRKRQQVESLIHYVEDALSRRPVGTAKEVVEFGAGSGHVCLLLAYRNPEVRFVLAERKEFSVEQAKERIAQSNLSNVDIFCDDIRNFEYSRIGLGIGLHCCGLLTDFAIRLCTKAQASFVIVPCCYGQISKPPPDIYDTEYAMGCFAQDYMHRGALLAHEDPCSVTAISSGADISVNFNHAPLDKMRTPQELEKQHTSKDSNINIYSNASYDGSGPSGAALTCANAGAYDDIDYYSEELLASEKNSQRKLLLLDYQLAKRCMRIVDIDRAMRANNEIGVLYQARYTFMIASLKPVSCSPKNNIMIGLICTH
jgi:hypothetical protein